MIDLLNAAVASHRAGDLERARALYEDVLRADPSQADALHMLGVLAQQRGDLPRARELIEAAVAARPTLALAQYNLGNVRAQQGDVPGAIAAYESAVAASPGFVEARSNLGNLYQAAGRRDDALAAYGAAIAARPDFAPAHANLGTLLIEAGRYDDAVRVLETALQLAPGLPEAHANLGQALRRSGRYAAAMAASRKAIELRPDYRDAYLNLAAAAYEIDDFDAAEAANARAAEIDPACAQAHANMASVYHATGRYALAVAACDRALALNPDYAEAHANRALSLLVQGDGARGWADYPWIWRQPAKRAAYPYLDRFPLWGGEPFPGRSLLVTREQGYGDAIQMARFLSAVKARGGTVALEVAPALAALFDGLPGVDELRVVEAVTLPRADVDLHLPLLGLAGVFAASPQPFGDGRPYLRADPARVERWRPRLATTARRRVGFAWSGSAQHVDDRHRSCRPEEAAPLGAIADVAWFGLQKGPGEERRSCGPLAIDPLGPEIADFADTAAIVAQLDLVIAVDTSVVHLAGALGTPVWTLLPFVPDWRWLLARADTPWYPSMRLFRQPAPGDWGSVFAAVARELA